MVCKDVSQITWQVLRVAATWGGDAAAAAAACPRAELTLWLP
jgi:hypothetical protein